VKIIIDCDCGTKTVVKLCEPLFCKKCGRKPTFKLIKKEEFYRFEGTFYAVGARPTEERKADFRMFKRLLFQVRDKAISEESYLYFLAGYFGVVPAPEDLEIPEKGYFKLEEKEAIE